jgi:hypothetical protein
MTNGVNSNLVGVGKPGVELSLFAALERDLDVVQLHLQETSSLADCIRGRLIGLGPASSEDVGVPLPLKANSVLITSLQARAELLTSVLKHLFDTLQIIKDAL